LLGACPCTTLVPSFGEVAAFWCLDKMPRSKKEQEKKKKIGGGKHKGRNLLIRCA